MNLINLILLGISIILPLPHDLVIETGYLSQYAKGPTDGTIAYRQSVGQLPVDMSHIDGVIAVADCDKIGHLAWLSIDDGPWLLVAAFDCSGSASTTAWMRDNRILGEASWYMARDHGFLGEGGVEARIAWP